MAMAWFSVWGKEKNQVPYGTFLGFHVESHMEPLHMGYNTRWGEKNEQGRVCGREQAIYESSTWSLENGGGGWCAAGTR